MWRASNETLGVQRAVKLIRSEAESRENTDRLLHEAQAAARLADPAIVRVFDFGKTHHGDPFLVMEMLRGEDLANAIRRKERASAPRALRMILPVIRALEVAHHHGIVHRDLKPENIFLTKTEDGRIQPKLLDFGIAKLKDMQSLRLTSAGSVLGSPLYMSPEQARGEEVDERTDIWAISVVLYEIVTGQPPFLGDTRAEVFAAATKTTPKSLPSLGLGDESLWGIFLKGLAKSPQKRFQTMRELGQAIASWLLQNKISEDITGASLEAGWFRESPRSFLSSTLPPVRASLIAPPLGTSSSNPALATRGPAAARKGARLSPGAPPPPEPASSRRSIRFLGLALDPQQLLDLAKNRRVQITAGVSALVVTLVLWAALGGEKPPGGAEPQAARALAAPAPPPTVVVEVGGVERRPSQPGDGELGEAIDLDEVDAEGATPGAEGEAEPEESLAGEAQEGDPEPSSAGEGGSDEKSQGGDESPPAKSGSSKSKRAKARKKRPDAPGRARKRRRERLMDPF